MDANLLSPRGVVGRWGDYDKTDLKTITGAESFSMFGELHDSNLEKIIASTEALGPEVASTPLETEYTYPDSHGFDGQLKQVAKLIKIGVQNHATERVAFFTEVHGFDTHSNMLSVTDICVTDISVTDTSVTVISFGRSTTRNSRKSMPAWRSL